MKIEKLTENKIRIILNIDDLVKKNIDVHSLIKNNDMSQKLFKKILKQAEKEVGFEVENSRLLIEAFISTDGFFILTFTKIANDTKSEKAYVVKPKAKRKNTNPSSEIAIYQFESFNEFENFCTYLNNSKTTNLNGFAKKISLYEYNSTYFLVLSNIDKNYNNSKFFYTAISEFAKLASTSSYFESRILEYGKIVLKNNALKNGIKFFAKA